MKGLSDALVVIIGGSSGIGFRVAQLAAQEGARLLIAGRHSDRLQQACQELQQQKLQNSLKRKFISAHHTLLKE